MSETVIKKASIFPTKNTILRHYVDIVGLKDPISFFCQAFILVCITPINGQWADIWPQFAEKSCVGNVGASRDTWSAPRQRWSAAKKEILLPKWGPEDSHVPWETRRGAAYDNKPTFLFHYNPFLGISFLSSSLWQDVIKKVSSFSD